MIKFLGHVMLAFLLVMGVGFIYLPFWYVPPKHPMTAICFSISGSHAPVVYYHEDTIVLDQTGFWSKDGKIRYYPPFGEGCKLVDGKFTPPKAPVEDEAPEQNGLKLPYKHPLEDHLSPDPDMGDREVQENSGSNKLPVFKSI